MIEGDVKDVLQADPSLCAKLAMTHRLCQDLQQLAASRPTAAEQVSVKRDDMTASVRIASDGMGERDVIIDEARVEGFAHLL